MKGKIKEPNKYKENKIGFVICKVCQSITLTGSLEMLINTSTEPQEKKKDRSRKAVDIIMGVLRV